MDKLKLTRWKGSGDVVSITTTRTQRHGNHKDKQPPRQYICCMEPVDYYKTEYRRDYLLMTAICGSSSYYHQFLLK